METGGFQRRPYHLAAGMAGFCVFFWFSPFQKGRHFKRPSPFAPLDTLGFGGVFRSKTSPGRFLQYGRRRKPSVPRSSKRTPTTPLCEGPLCRRSGVQNTQNFFSPIANVRIDLVFQGEMRHCRFLLLRLILVRSPLRCSRDGGTTWEWVPLFRTKHFY